MARALSGAAEQCDLLVKAYTGKKQKKEVTRKHCVLRRITSAGGFLFNLKIVLSTLYKVGQ